jgi:hypothetical protein
MLQVALAIGLTAAIVTLLLSCFGPGTPKVHVMFCMTPLGWSFYTVVSSAAGIFSHAHALKQVFPNEVFPSQDYIWFRVQEQDGHTHGELYCIDSATGILMDALTMSPLLELKRNFGHRHTVLAIRTEVLSKGDTRGLD